MYQNLLYELHSFQFHQVKIKADVVNKLELKPSEGVILHGLEALPKYSDKKFPVSILFHGYTSNYRRVAYIANSLLTNGVAVILMNLRGHGKSSGKQKDVNGMQQDIDVILNYVKSKSVFDEQKILLLGISLGALITLTAGYNHPDLTYLIALAGMSSPVDLLEGMTACRRWRWKLIGKLGGLDVPSMIGQIQYTPKMQPQSKNQHKKILLLHCKNDALVAVNNFWINTTAYGIKPKDYALFSRGGHSFFLIKNQVLKTIHTWLGHNNFYNAE